MKNKMKQLIDIIESIHTKCTKLDFTDFNDFLNVFVAVLGYDIQKQTRRIFDPGFADDPDILFIDFSADLLEMSRSDVRRLMKNNGIKVNNKAPGQDLKVVDLPWLELDGHKICVIKSGKNKFDFIIWS